VVSAARPRQTLARISSAGYFQMNGCGSAFQWSTQRSIASTSCSTLLNVPRRSLRSVSRWNHHSTLGGREPADARFIRHEAKHANQWAWFGGGAIFPLVYAVSPRTWESQAGLSDGCYQKPSRDGC
jgi:hypothetical protein